MNDAELDRAWRSPRNQPAAAAVAEARDRFLGDLERRRRGARLLLALVGGVLALLTGRVLVAAWPGATPPAVELARDWASLLFLAVPWAGFVMLARRMLRHERAHAGAERSVGAAVRALRDENAMARARLKVVAGLHGATLVLLPLVVWQLRAAGKAGDEILAPAFIGWPAVAGAILAALWWHDRRHLRPRARQLDELLREHDAAA